MEQTFSSEIFQGLILPQAVVPVMTTAVQEDPHV